MPCLCVCQMVSAAVSEQTKDESCFTACLVLEIFEVPVNGMVQMYLPLLFCVNVTEYFFVMIPLLYSMNYVYKV